MRHKIVILSLLVPLFLWFSCHVRAIESDSIPQVKEGNVVERLINYFEKSNKNEITTRPHFSFLAGPHYSKESGFALGLILGGNYSTAPQDSTVPVSNISLVGDIGTSNLVMVGVRGEHFFNDNNRRINYSLSLLSQTSYFWGIGYDWAIYNGNKVKYRELDLKFTGAFEWRLAGHFFVGPVIDAVFFNARDPQSETPWLGEPLSHPSVAAGGKISFDTRDNHTSTKKGVYIELSQLFAPRFFGNGHYSFSETEFSVNFFCPMLKGATLATRLHGAFTYGRTPWGRLPSVGEGTMRSYYEGRYRDKDCVDLIAELRQKLTGRIGVVVWGGGGSVSPSLHKFQKRQILPEAGIGARWEFKKNSNIRIDYGLGRHSSGFVFSLNESF